LSKTQGVTFYSDFFWAYDVALGVFLKHLIDVAKAHPEEGKLSEEVLTWGTAYLYGLNLSDTFRSAADIETFISFASEACSRLKIRSFFPAEEVMSWMLADEPALHISPRGDSQIATGPVVELGQAIVALISGRLDEPPPGYLWLYGLPDGRQTLRRRQARQSADHIQELIEKFHSKREWRLFRLQGIVDARSPHALEFLEELLQSEDAGFRIWAIQGLDKLGSAQARKALADARRLTFATDEETAYFRWHLDRVTSAGE
jgi:hypothetical protein